MSDSSVSLKTIILHAYAWPANAELASWRRLSSPSARPIWRLVEAREDEAAPIGAAAIVNRVAATSRDRIIIVAQPCVSWTDEQLHSIANAAQNGLSIGISSGSPQIPSPSDPSSPFETRRLWAINRELFQKLDGLDSRLWSVGEVHDLEMRARVAGASITPVTLDGHWVGPESYPLRQTTRRFLEIRNRLITAFKTLPFDALGPELAALTALALTESWQSAEIDERAFQFGSRSRAWPADEAKTLIPLLAIDSFLSEVPSLLVERRRILGMCDGKESNQKVGRLTDEADLIGSLCELLKPQASRRVRALPRRLDEPSTQAIVPDQVVSG